MARAGVTVYFPTPEVAEAARLACSGSPEADKVSGADLIAAENAIEKALGRLRTRWAEASELEGTDR